MVVGARADGWIADLAMDGVRRVLGYHSEFFSHMDGKWIRRRFLASTSERESDRVRRTEVPLATQVTSAVAASS